MRFDRFPCSCQLVIPARTESVRDALCNFFEKIGADLPSPEMRFNVELILAEVLNNIVEHGYRGLEGEIELVVTPAMDGLVFRVADSGHPMPDEILPEGNLPEHGCIEDLPEGGFGWFLIRELSKDLEYRRESGRNLLSFRVCREQSGGN